jgi:hypothetical protein
MSSEKPKSGKLKRETKSSKAEAGDGSIATPIPPANTEVKFGMALMKGEAPVVETAQRISPPSSTSTGSTRRKTLTGSKEHDKPLTFSGDSKRGVTASSDSVTSTSTTGSRTSIKLSTEKDKDKKDKDKEVKDKDKKDKEKKEKKDKKDKTREKKEPKDSDDIASIKAARKPKRSLSTNNIKKGHISHHSDPRPFDAHPTDQIKTVRLETVEAQSSTTRVGFERHDSDGRDSSEDDDGSTDLNGGFPSRRDSYIGGASSLPETDSVLISPRSVSSPIGFSPSKLKKPDPLDDAPVLSSSVSPRPVTTTAAPTTTATTEKQRTSPPSSGKVRTTDSLPRRKSARAVNKKISSKPKPLQFPSPTNRTIAGELLQYSLTSDGYWAEAFAGHPVPPHIDDLFAIQDDRRDASLFPLQNFNNHYEYHSQFANVPHINFLGFDNLIGPILVSITQEAFISDSTSPRTVSKQNLMARQLSATSIKSGKQAVTSSAPLPSTTTTHSNTGSTSSPSTSANSASSTTIAAPGGASVTGNAGANVDSVTHSLTSVTLSVPPNLVMSPNISQRAESQRNIKLPAGWGQEKGEKGERQLSSASLQTLFTSDSLGFHRALIRSKVGDVVVKIPAIHTKRKYPKGHTLLNALIATQPAVPFDWEKVDFKEATLSKDTIVKMELKLVPKHYKFGVIFARSGQFSDNQFLENAEGSDAFDKFMSTIAKKIELKNWPGYTGGLDVSHGQTGKYSYFTKFRDYDIMFHVSTLLPHVQGDEQQLEKKRHIGNDVVVVVFQDGETPISPETIKSYFNHVFIIVHPIKPEGIPQSASSISPAASSSSVVAQDSSASSTASTATNTSSSASTLRSSPSKRSLTSVGDGSSSAVASPGSGHSRVVSESIAIVGSSSSGSRKSSTDSTDDMLVGGGSHHSPSSPSLLQRLSEHAANISPSRRSPIFSRASRSATTTGGSPPAIGILPATPTSSSLTAALTTTKTSASNTGSSPTAGSSAGHQPGSISPGGGTRIPILRYNTITPSTLSDAGLMTPSNTSPGAQSARERQSTLGIFGMERDRMSDDSMDSPDRSSGGRSPRINDASGEARSASSAEEGAPISGPFMDPVSLAAMPSGGPLPANWSDSLVQQDSASDIDGSLSNLASAETSTNASETSISGTSDSIPSVTSTQAQELSMASSQLDMDAFGSDSITGDDGDDPETTKRMRLQRRLSTGMGSSRQLVKSTKSGKLSKALPQITRAKLNVAAKERQAHPPIQFRIEVVSKDGVVSCDPKLPSSPIFSAGPYFREFFLTKLINAERAAYFSKHFSKPIERTRELLMQEMLDSNR